MHNKGPTANEFFNGFTGALTGNPSLVSNPLGTSDGYGFGWDDVWVYKVGVNREYNPRWTFRTGYNCSKVPYDDDQALFNVLAPAAVEHHVTAGFTYNVSPAAELTVTYMHAFRNKLDYRYSGSGPYQRLSSSAKNEMFQNAIEASYAWKFYGP
jgi:long-chain fatty acid transport protein